MDTKQCVTCKKTLPSTTDYFNKRSNARTLKSSCKPCSAKATRRYRNANPANRLLHGIKSRQPNTSLTVADLHVPDVCPVLGIPIIKEYTGRTDSTPSVDRIDNTKGYEPGNVKVISWRANRLKNDATVEEILAIADYVRRNK